MRNPEGESDHGPLRPLFDRRLKLEFHGSRVTSDAGLLAYRELDDALGLTALAGGVLADSRTGRNGWHGIVSLLRQSVYGRLAGYEDVNDADRLGRDPAMCWIVGGKAVERGGASTSQMGRFETELLSNNENLVALADLSGMWIDRVHDHDPPRRVVLDMDSSDSPTFGEQEGTAYNGHFGCTCYHPLFVFNQFGDLERCALRPGNVHSAHGWRDVLVPVVERYKERAIRLYFRGDAAFASPEIYDYLEAEGMLYAIRLPANKVLQESIAHLLKRPVGRPPKDVRRYHASFSYQAGTWDKPRRVVAKVEWHPGELYPRVGFIVTNLGRPAERVVAFYNQRGTAEQWIKEGKNAIRWTRLSCRRFDHNAVRLQLHALAYRTITSFVLPRMIAPDPSRHCPAASRTVRPSGKRGVISAARNPRQALSLTTSTSPRLRPKNSRYSVNSSNPAGQDGVPARDAGAIASTRIARTAPARMRCIRFLMVFFPLWPARYGGCCRLCAKWAANSRDACGKTNTLSHRPHRNGRALRPRIRRETPF